MNDPVVLFTAITALFTAVLAVFTILLALYTRRLAVTSEQTAERQLRAYVQVELEKIDFSTASTTEIVLLARNVGQTPAYDVTVYSWVDFRPFPQQPGGIFEGPPGSESASKSIINGGRAIRNKTGTARPLTKDEAAAIADGRSIRLYIYGRVAYVDAFKKARYTNFCLALSGAPNQKCDIAICAIHNDAN